MLLVLILILSGCASDRSASVFIEPAIFRLQTVDVADWSALDLDDRAWPRVGFSEVPGTDGVLILRSRVSLDAGLTRGAQPIGVYVAALAACEVAWDGELVGRSGQPAPTVDLEVPGPVENIWVIPDRLALSGVHLLALRCTAHHRHFHPLVGFWAVLVGDYEGLLSLTRSSAWFALSSLSGMLMIGIFAIFMYFADRRDRSFLLLAAVCFCGAVLLLAESWRALHGYTYNWHLLRLIVITALTALVNLAIVGFVVVRYPARGARSVLLGMLALLCASLLVQSWDGKALCMFVAGLGLGTIWMLRAAARRQRGSLPALAGLIASLGALAWHPYNFTDVILYIALDILLVCLLVAHTIHLRHFRLAHERSLIKSARLESELLRKHIQPHFLMNTLTVLSEWIEQEPAVAVKMIESLSAEFRILARIADQSLITLGTELDLCRTHIQIMNCRSDRECVLEVRGVDECNLVPPAIFHTLVENAITHDDSEQRHVCLRLTMKPGQDGDHYVLEAPYNSSTPIATEGSGLRYVRARLQESFPGGWSLTSGPAHATWRTEIVIPHRQ